MIILRQKEFGRTGKTKEENKKFFTKEVDRKARRAENRRRAIEEGFNTDPFFAVDKYRNGERLDWDKQKETLKTDRVKRKDAATVEKDIERVSANTKTKRSNLGRLFDEVKTQGTKDQIEKERSSLNILRSGRESIRDEYGHKEEDGLNKRINQGKAGTREARYMDYDTRKHYKEGKAELEKKKNSTKQKEEVAEGLVKKGLNKWKNLSKGKKIAAIATPAVAATGIGVAIHKSKKKKSEEDSK